MRCVAPVLLLTAISLAACTPAESSPQDMSSQTVQPQQTQVTEIASPDGQNTFVISDEGGQLRYRVLRGGAEVIGNSRLGLRLLDQNAFDMNLRIISSDRFASDTTWEQPWGERRVVRDNHIGATLEVQRTDTDARMFIDIKMFDDGLGFRYRIPNTGDVAVIDELTEFNIGADTTSWTIPARMYNRYEYLYDEKPVGALQLVHTPATFETQSGVHLSIHEAALVNYSAMSLEQNREGVLEADLSPRSDGVKVRLNGDILTPWRTIQIADNAAGLVNSDLILNLNEPNQLGDVSWVEPGKYAGIWWEQHIREGTWGSTKVTSDAPNRHAATTQATKDKIDFAADNGFIGVLVEGWNIGWDGDWFNNGDVFSFTETYPDYDFKGLADYADEKGVRLIGHHETSGNITNYENQLNAGLDLMRDRGVRVIKTGYVADAGNIKRVDENGVAHYEYHDSQALVDHHLKVVREAAKRKISINTHEPVKDTGLRRTYPNWVSREGARGQEFNAWGVPPNGPDHALDLIFTRMLSGPMDYTAGAFDLRPNEQPPVGEDLLRNSTASRIEHTLAKELSLYVAIYSPVQMVMDLERNYAARPDAFQFIKDVPTDWEESLALDGEVGDFAVIARKDRDSEDWYLAALTDADARNINVDLSFLDDGTYEAQIYRDGAEADYETNPYDIVIENRDVTQQSTMSFALGRSGGAVVRFKKK